MKKSLLFLCGVGIALGVNAQSSTPAKYVLKRINQFKNIQETQTPSAQTPPAVRKTPLVITNGAITDVPLGQAGNILGGYTTPGRSILSYNETLTTLTIIHRGCPACTPADSAKSSGSYMLDYSTDGGTTWETLPSDIVWQGSTNPSRYPQGCIMNPTGNSTAANAYFTYHGPALNGAASVFSGYTTGSIKVANLKNLTTTPNTSCAKTDLFTGGSVPIAGATLNFNGSVPESGMLTANNTFWVSDHTCYDGAGADEAIYTDTLLLRKGVWNTVTNCTDWGTTKIPFPVTTIGTGSAAVTYYTISNVAFDATGQIGYLSVIANADPTIADTAQYITIWKTTNGGTTWSTPTKISNDVHTQMGDPAGTNYYVGYDLDGAVDKNGKLHLITSVHPALPANSFSIEPGKFGDFSLISDGTTSTWTLLDKPEDYIGEYDKAGYYEFPRGQVAIDAAGDKVAYVWFVTDTVTWAPDTSLHGYDNVHPDAKARFYDVTTSSLDPITNLTAGTVADGAMTFGYVANLMGTGGACGAGSYQVQLGYQAMNTPGTATNPVNFHYVGGACLTSVNEIGNDVFSIGDAYPNPTTGLTTIDLNLKQNSNLSIEVTNMLGQAVYTTSLNHLATGDQKFTVDASKWNSGVYFYTVKSKDFAVTKKLIRQ